jgi:creatinine amidohydrolase
MESSVIRYEELTWPEVAALPRDLPLVLPLGDGYDVQRICQDLGATSICMLPVLPYGWHGSLLDVAPEMLRRLVDGIWTGPREEGFTRLVVCHAGDEDLEGSGTQQIRIERWQSEPIPLLSASPQRVILIPVGHTEQHAYHLPMGTDTFIIDAIMAGVAAAAPGQAERLPTLPYGVSMFRSSFAGTFSIGGRMLEDWLVAVIGGLAARGADRFYLNSGHGGNCSFMHNAVKYAGNRYRGIFAATTWLHTSGQIGTEAIARYRRSGVGGMGHACELETAYLLHLRPDLCRMDRVEDEVDFITTENYYMDWVEGGALVASPPWEDDTTTGAYGAGSLATAENGARWLQAAIKEKVGHVEEIHQQQNRRLARRAERKLDIRSERGTTGA